MILNLRWKTPILNPRYTLLISSTKQLLSPHNPVDLEAELWVRSIDEIEVASGRMDTSLSREVPCGS